MTQSHPSSQKEPVMVRVPIGTFYNTAETPAVSLSDERRVFALDEEVRYDVGFEGFGFVHPPGPAVREPGYYFFVDALGEYGVEFGWET